MAVDLDWLVSRFDKVSIEYPGLSLVAVPAPARFTESNSVVDYDPSEDYCFYYPKLRSSKYEPQWYWASKNTMERDERGIILFSTKNYLEFPRWYFSDGFPVFEQGWWAMWLHRTFGFDPSNEDPNQKLQTNAECLRAYLPLFELATKVLLEHYEYEEWFIKWCSNCKARQFNSCGPWLLFILAHYKNIRKEQDVCVIDDIGIATILALRAFKEVQNRCTSDNNQLSPQNTIALAESLSPPSELLISADVPPCPYQKLWVYAQKTWVPGTNKFKICEYISKGPGNYTECLEHLIPNINRTAQTRRFHAVKGPMNKEIISALRLEVYRLGEQILIREVGRTPPPKSNRKPTTKKSTAKRNR